MYFISTSTRISLCMHDVETWKRETVILSYINLDFVIVYKPAFNFVDPYNHVTTLNQVYIYLNPLVGSLTSGGLT